VSPLEVACSYIARGWAPILVMADDLQRLQREVA
jgi:hypothetical protein